MSRSLNGAKWSLTPSQPTFATTSPPSLPIVRPTPRHKQRSVFNSLNILYFTYSVDRPWLHDFDCEYFCAIIPWYHVVNCRSPRGDSEDFLSSQGELCRIFGPKVCVCALFRNALSTAGNSTTSSERPSPEPRLKEEASPAVRERILEMLWPLQMPWTVGLGRSQPYSLEGNFRKSASGVFPECFPESLSRNWGCGLSFLLLKDWTSLGVSCLLYSYVQSRKCAINHFWTKNPRGLLGWASRGSRQIIYVRIFPNVCEVFSGPPAVLT